MSNARMEVTNLITPQLEDSATLNAVHVSVPLDVDVYVRLMYSERPAKEDSMRCQVFLLAVGDRNISNNTRSKFLADLVLDSVDLPTFFVSSQMFTVYGPNTELISTATYINSNGHLYVYEWEYFKKYGTDLGTLEMNAPELDLTSMDPESELAVMLVCGKYSSYTTIQVKSLLGKST